MVNIEKYTRSEDIESRGKIPPHHSRKTQEGQSTKTRVHIAPSNPNFVGKELEFEAYSYILGYDKGGTFTSTTKDISEYVGCTYRNGVEVKRRIDKLQLVILSLPNTINSIPFNEITNPEFTSTDKRIWESKFDEYVR